MANPSKKDGEFLQARMYDPHLRHSTTMVCSPACAARGDGSRERGVTPPKTTLSTFIAGVPSEFLTNQPEGDTSLRASLQFSSLLLSRLERRRSDAKISTTKLLQQAVSTPHQNTDVRSCRNNHMLLRFIPGGSEQCLFRACRFSRAGLAKRRSQPTRDMVLHPLPDVLTDLPQGDLLRKKKKSEGISSC